MQKDSGKGRKTFFEPATPPMLTPKVEPKILPPLFRKRRNASPEKPPDDTNIQEIAEPETCEVLTRFLTSQGLPLEAIQDTMFQNLFYSLDSSKTIPTPGILKEYTEKLGVPMKYSKALSKATGPLSVTIDVIEKENGDNYFTFSIHFFEGLEERKCLINLKKLLISEIEAENILTVIRRAISTLNHHQVKTAYFVVPNERMFEMFKPYNDVIKHQLVSFHHLLEKFAKSILEIDVFSVGIQQLRAFVALIRAVPDLYWKLQKVSVPFFESNIDLPILDNQNSWISTAKFLTECLILNPKFENFSIKWNVSHISQITYIKLSFLYKVLYQCIKHAKDLSGEENSISQIIPTIMSMRNYIFDNLTNGSSFESEVRKRFVNIFQELFRSPMRRRYDMATLLDPRVAYNQNIYPNSKWSALEKFVIEELVDKSDFQSNREFVNSTREAKIQKVQGELDAYTIMCIESRPNANESLFEWWNSQKDNLENLVLIAREYLACPAVSIDAQQFFGSGGKFSNLVEIYDSESLESYLNCAGHHQQFLGHGSNIEHIPGNEIAKLNVVIHRTRCLRAAPKGIVSPKVVNIRDKIPIRDQNSSVHSFGQILEIEPEDVKLEDVDPEYVLEDPKDSKDSIDPIEKEIKLEPLDSEEHKEPEGSKQPIVPIQNECKPLDIDSLEDVKLEFEDPLEMKLEQMDYQYALDAYARIEKEHNYYKSIGATRKKWVLGQPMTVLKAVKPHGISTEAVESPKKMEPSIDNDELMEMKPDIEELNGGHQKSTEEKIEPWTSIYEPMSTGLVHPVGHSSSRRFLNAKCQLCETMRPTTTLKNVTLDNERLFLLLGGVLSYRLDILQACFKYGRRHFRYYCYSHFQESCHAIFEELGVESSEEILKCDKAKFYNILRRIAFVRKLPSSYEQTKMMLATLTGKYHVEPENKASPKSTKQFEFVTPEPPITPKEERVPRKQTLEKDTESTVRIIETAPFKLPDYSKECARECSEELKKCCFCLITTRNEMLRVPKSHDRLQRWIHKFGEEFAKRLNSNGDNYICRSHFSPNAFSRRGRLLKGMMPETEVLKSEATYQIDGDNLWRIEEPEASKPRGRPRREEPEEEYFELSESSEDEDSEHSDYTPGDYDYEAPSRPRGRPRKYPKIEKEDVEEDSEDEQICRFCSEITKKTEAFKGNKNCIRLSEWNKYLGVDFVRNLDYRGNNYVCKKHFRKISCEQSSSLDS